MPVGVQAIVAVAQCVDVLARVVGVGIRPVRQGEVVVVIPALAERVHVALRRRLRAVASREREPKAATVEAHVRASQGHHAVVRIDRISEIVLRAVVLEFRRTLARR